MAERLILEEAIEHAKQIAKEKRKMSEEFWDYNDIHGVNKKQKAKCISCAEEHEQLAIWLAELKRYKDLEEQHRLIELPCAVGDTVYEVQEIRKRIQEYTIISIHFSHSSILIGWEINDGKGIYSNLNGFEVSAIGKTVFLTKEEAEAKLKELRGVQE